ncbi:hypothetical protein ACFSBZ_02470 [Amnibacterium flavum]|uniref:Uncharacterized protein n=1 Tax=Amnibacterium flavum TaxID=2173173 RepID=A0A2V1HPP4_9MICO|nr:hypothetical protein [Amnibacterium flavum]PVZ94603.1 hypothetical protein DDQ50_12975 [Amnibacterium flavum]
MTDKAVPSDNDDLIGKPFDQTNGVVSGLDGDSDGLADSDTESSAERERDREGRDSHIVADYRPE